MAIATSILGFPRIGARRELKFAQEGFWSGKIDAAALQSCAQAIRLMNWRALKERGLNTLPGNDFSFYDQMLDTSVMLGAIPSIYGWRGGAVSLDTYFAMARGTRGENSVPALEMTKWFDTNYHYLVPELTKRQDFALASTKPLDEYREAKAAGFETRPVLVGPITWLKLAKAKDQSFDPIELLPGIIPVYAEILRQLHAAGAKSVQMDEPVLALDLNERERAAFRTAYGQLTQAIPSLKLVLTSYFGGLGDNLDTVLRLTVSGFHLDLVRDPDQLETVLSKAPQSLALSLGVIDGRNVWRADLNAILDAIEPAIQRFGGARFTISSSCSLLHSPIDLALEEDIDSDLKNWLAFGLQKVDEIVLLGRALDAGRASVKEELAQSGAAAASRRASAKIHDAAVQKRIKGLKPEMTKRGKSFDLRRPLQAASLKLPAFPTTTIGSFPQTAEIRKARSDHAKGALTDGDYETFLKSETKVVVAWQEEVGLDVLVHGEFERNDMVQYFGEQLQGFAFTRHGWVQSYGSRCVRPPIIFGDVSRPRPMTVEWAAYAQSLTRKPMKGMLTGPVTMLQWSFVRNDQPRSETCRQIALALRDEVRDLEAAGIGIIQIDEPALREGLPLRHADWTAYLDWAVDCFRLAASGVADETQIHTHMCYSEFNDIIDAIGRMDADVISIETARSKMELLGAFASYKYPNEIGPGVYDIHAPRQPSVEEMVALLTKASERLSSDQIWVNPDCGLKTRRWEEVRPTLVAMVEAARQMRSAA